MRAVFAVNGLVSGCFAGSLPGLRTVLHLGEGAVVAVLVLAAAGSVLAMRVSGLLADRVGPRRPAYAFAAALCVGAVAAALAHDRWWLLVAAAVYGAGNGGMDVSMNVLAVRVERARGRASMSGFHAWYSLGALAGAGLVVLAGRLIAGSSAVRVPAPVAAAAGVVLLAAVWPGARGPEQLPEPPAGPASGRAGLRGVPRTAWLLAAMAVCFGFSEGTAMDWSSLHVTSVAGVAPSTGALGLACFSFFMVAIRLVGDAVVDRLGGRLVVRCGAVVAVAGYLLTVTQSGLLTLLVGWSLVGLGAGLAAPQIYGRAGHLGGGRSLAFVVTFGYAAFLAGPGVIGFAVARLGIQHAMVVPLLTSVLLALFAAALAADRPRSDGPGEG